jgi:hypothetical protein
MKNPNTNSKKRKRATQQIRDPDPSCTYGYRSIPITLALVNHLVEALPKWINDNPDEKFITKFYLSNRMARATYFELLAKHEHLKEVHDEAMRALGERMLGRAVDNKANFAAVKHVLHRYAPEFNQDDEHHAKLRQDEAVITGLQTLYLQEVKRTVLLDEFVESKKPIDVKVNDDKNTLE